MRQVTRSRVLAAIDQLGYRPNTAARALASGRSKTLGVIALDTTLYGPASTLSASSRRLSARATSCRSWLSTRSTASQYAMRSPAYEPGRRGLAVITPFASAHDALAVLPSATPIVAVEGDPDGEVAVVTVDQAAGARLATQHLLAAGYDTVFHVAGPAEWQEAGGRTAGWRATLEDAGADVTPPLFGDWSARSGYNAGQVLAQVPDAAGHICGQRPDGPRSNAGALRAGPAGT